MSDPPSTLAAAGDAAATIGSSTYCISMEFLPRDAEKNGEAPASAGSSPPKDAVSASNPSATTRNAGPPTTRTPGAGKRASRGPAPRPPHPPRHAARSPTPDSPRTVAVSRSDLSTPPPTLADTSIVGPPARRAVAKAPFTDTDTGSRNASVALASNAPSAETATSPGAFAGVTHRTTPDDPHAALTGPTLPKRYARSLTSANPTPCSATADPPPAGMDAGDTEVRAAGAGKCLKDRQPDSVDAQGPPAPRLEVGAARSTRRVHADADADVLDARDRAGRRSSVPGRISQVATAEDTDRARTEIPSP